MCRPDPEFTAEFRYFGRLPELLKPDYRDATVVYAFREHPAVKDAIEAMGAPHTEVDIILANGRSVGFDYQLQHGDAIYVYPPGWVPAVVPARHLSPAPPSPVAFILDVHLGRLARRLRLLGFDSLYSNDFSDATIMATALAEGRIILTRDRGILKHRKVAHGYLVRSGQIDEQVREVLVRYALFESIRPWQRCLACNGVLVDVDKAEIEHRLEPKTRRYYQHFHRCSTCDRLYWQGSHYQKINAWLLNYRG